MFVLKDPTDAAHVVQLTLTPIFLLTGLASPLNIFTTRLGRVADSVDKLSDAPELHPRQLARLRLRSQALEAAVLLAGAGWSTHMLRGDDAVPRSAAQLSDRHGPLPLLRVGAHLRGAGAGLLRRQDAAVGPLGEWTAQPDGDRQETDR